MLTQLVRYGRMLKVNFKGARCKVKAHWTSEGSVFAGTITSKCHAVETLVEVESDDEPARIAVLLRNAEGGCYAQAALKEPVKVSGSVTLNGRALDYMAYPSAVGRR